jgi:hypothetical protein
MPALDLEAVGLVELVVEDGVLSVDDGSLDSDVDTAAAETDAESEDVDPKYKKEKSWYEYISLNTELNK